MFNAPRTGQRYAATSNISGLGGLGTSFVDENPLANSVYDDVDPWSAAPTPPPPPLPRQTQSTSTGAPGSVLGDATPPAIYHAAFGAVASNDSMTEEASVNALSRVLNTSGLPATIVDKIVNLVSTRPRVSKSEFFVALALAALAQQGRDTSVEQVAALASQNDLPEPALDLMRLQPSASTFSYNNNRPYTRPSAPPAAPSYSQDDVWNTGTTNARFPPSGNGYDAGGGAEFNVGGGSGGDFNPRATGAGAGGSLAGTGLPKEWWTKQKTCKVRLLGAQGFILNRYMVYEISTERGVVTRRYSEFVFLWDCLTRRYPFRLFPALPPKRVAADEPFLEQRRRGLQRSLGFIINHPIISMDGLLQVFLTEASFEAWRKNTPVSLDEESASKKVGRVEEMSVPSDLEDKVATIRTRLPPLIDQWQRICILVERIIRRREAAASDLSRVTNTLRAVNEVNRQCWRGDDCELSGGVRTGVEHIAAHLERAAEVEEARTQVLLDTMLESLKSQRDLYLATRDLFIRHDRLSVDNVDKLKKRVDTNSVKLDGIRAAAKEGWEEEAERLAGTIEKDKASIVAMMSRRVFIRACLWHELRVVLHNRENALLSIAAQKFAREEHEYAENVANNWISLGDSVECMVFNLE